MQHAAGLSGPDASQRSPPPNVPEPLVGKESWHRLRQQRHRTRRTSDPEPLGRTPGATALHTLLESMRMRPAGPKASVDTAAVLTEPSVVRRTSVKGASACPPPLAPTLTTTPPDFAWTAPTSAFVTVVPNETSASSPVREHAHSMLTTPDSSASMPDTARERFETAANESEALFENTVGILEAQRNPAAPEVLLHFAQAGSLGSSQALFNLGVCFETGKGGVPQDAKRAVYYYQLAADVGHAKSLYNLAMMHARGHSAAHIPRSARRARALLQAAADLQLPEVGVECSWRQQ